MFTEVSQSLSRERIRGSPRFPHRIMPANSLGTIASGTNGPKPHRWHSMEDASRSKVSPSTSHIGMGTNTYDVWATHEVGIPLSELANSVRGQRQAEPQVLTIPADSNVMPDDALSSSDLRKLFGENNLTLDDVTFSQDIELKIITTTTVASTRIEQNRTVPMPRVDSEPEFSNLNKTNIVHVNVNVENSNDHSNNKDEKLTAASSSNCDYSSVGEKTLSDYT